jgi:hypothetical protein
MTRFHMTGISLIEKARRGVFQGEPGPILSAALEALPHCEAVAAPTSRTLPPSTKAASIWPYPDREFTAWHHRDIHHLPPDAPIYILRRAFPPPRYQLMAAPAPRQLQDRGGQSPR